MWHDGQLWNNVSNHLIGQIMNATIENALVRVKDLHSTFYLSKSKVLEIKNQVVNVKASGKIQTISAQIIMKIHFDKIK